MQVNIKLFSEKRQGRLLILMHILLLHFDSKMFHAANPKCQIFPLCAQSSLCATGQDFYRKLLLLYVNNQLAKHFFAGGRAVI